MSALHEAIDHTALGWVKPELDELLRQARIEVEAWSEAPGDLATLDTCAQLLQQVRGSLRMLELEAPALLADELRLLALALRREGTLDAGEASASLMRGLVQLPDYLERLQSGHRDVPVVLLPLLDELRAARGESAFDERQLAAMGDGEPATEAELAHARAALAGRNRALLDTVSAAVKEDLMQVKDALDLHLRGSQNDIAALQPHAAALGRIADTLHMIGLGGPGGSIAQQRDALQAIAAGDRPASEDALLDIAGALLRVDASLEEQVARMGDGGSAGTDDALSRGSRQVTGVLLHEAAADLGRIRDGVVAYMQDGWDRAAIADVPRLLQEVGGALRMLEQEHPADLASGIQAYVHDRLLADGAQPDIDAMDRLADAIAGLDMYLEGLDEGGRREDLLDIARTNLATLGYWPLPESATHQVFEEPAAQADAAKGHPEPAEASSMPAADDAAAATAEPALVAAAAHAPAAAGFEQAGEEIDDEIREVFLEEFEEEIANLGELLPTWRAEPDNVQLLRPIRRVFHTLKGSGRLVGARVLGEFSWKVENMLNRVLDGSRPASRAVIAVVEQAHAGLPQLHAALSGNGAVAVDLEALQQVADRVAAGEEVQLATASRASAAAEASEAADVAPGADDAGIPATVDPILLEILDTEVAGHIQTIERWLQSAGDAPQADEALLRALHTSNGAFAMTEVPAITDALAPAEGYVKRLLAHGLPASTAGVGALAALAAALRETMATLRGPSPRVHAVPGLVAQLQALRDALPEPAGHEEAPGKTEGETLDALGASAGFAIPDAIQPLAGTAVEALLHGHAGIASDHAEADRLAAERAEAERVAAQQAEAALLEAERIAFEREEAERIAAEQAQVERLAAEQAEAQRLEAERLAAEQAEAERLEAERVEAERLEAERLEAERLEAERLEAERLEAERLEAERIAAEQAEAARLAAEQAAAERLAFQQAEAARIAAMEVEAERLEAERVEAERLEAERLEAERLEAERLEAERLEAERLEAERLEAERLEAERLEAERLEAERLEAERVEAERVEAERLEAERLEAERLEAEAAAAADVADEEPAVDEVAPAPVDMAVANLLARVLAGEEPDRDLDTTGLDTELVDIFVEESGDLLDHSDGLLAQLRQSPDAREPLIGLQRDLHTIKGGARMAGVFTIGELGHAMESLLEAVVEQRCELDRTGIGLLEGGFDRLHAMVTRIGERRAIAMPHALIDAFNALARGRPLLAEDAATDAEPAPAKPELAPLSGPIAEPTMDDDVAIRAPQEQVRIRADLLDRLVNYAGEVAIYRARLEQQLGAFRAAMNEMEQTNTRLRDQLRRLDIETEAQIIARFQREGDAGDASFDPLELDRFSTLQQLSRALGESAADMASLQQTLDDLTRQYETLLLQQSRVSSELQEGLMRTRMVPFDALVPRLRRVLRQAASETGKQVQLRLDGTQGELDRNVLERMTAPLEHMLRNAVAHGIEAPDARRKAKKPAEGTVRIAVRREGSEVVLEVGDDGSGLDRAAIRRRAGERGLIREGVSLTDSDLDQLIFEPGFSTADEVSRLAGRGVGMDVVASEVRQLGGSLDIATRKQQGTTFTLRLPQTLAVTQAVFVRIGETQFAVPIASVRGVGRIGRELLGDRDAGYSYGGEEYALHDLGQLVGQGAAKAEGHLQMPLLLVRSGELRAAVAVDEIIGSREIVVKSVGPQVASIPGIFGATIMGDGSVVVILDVAPLARRHAVLPRETAPALASEQRPVPLVMVVDDSVTMRKVTGRVLERHNFEVITAKDGLDALERMDERVPDLMLLDIEMPRMDGYELAKHMKADPRLRDVLIMMITSRTGEKHRQRAFDLGVDRYLGKPYQEPELMRNVNELLKVPHGRE